MNRPTFLEVFVVIAIILTGGTVGVSACYEVAQAQKPCLEWGTEVKQVCTQEGYHYCHEYSTREVQVCRRRAP